MSSEQIHIIRWDPLSMIVTVDGFGDRSKASAQESRVPYTYNLWNPLFGAFLPAYRHIKPSSEKFNWSFYDRLVCGLETEFYADVRYRRIRLAILPIQANGSSPFVHRRELLSSSIRNSMALSGPPMSNKSMRGGGPPPMTSMHSHHHHIQHQQHQQQHQHLQQYSSSRYGADPYGPSGPFSGSHNSLENKIDEALLDEFFRARHELNQALAAYHAPSSTSSAPQNSQTQLSSVPAGDNSEEAVLSAPPASPAPPAPPAAVRQMIAPFKWSSPEDAVKSIKTDIATARTYLDVLSCPHEGQDLVDEASRGLRDKLQTWLALQEKVGSMVERFAARFQTAATKLQDAETAHIDGIKSLMEALTRETAASMKLQPCSLYTAARQNTMCSPISITDLGMRYSSASGPPSSSPLASPTTTVMTTTSSSSSSVSSSVSSSSSLSDAVVVCKDFLAEADPVTEKQLPVYSSLGACAKLPPLPSVDTVASTIVQRMFPSSYFHTRVPPKLGTKPGMAPQAVSAALPTQDPVGTMGFARPNPHSRTVKVVRLSRAAAAAAVAAAVAAGAGGDDAVSSSIAGAGIGAKTSGSGAGGMADSDKPSSIAWAQDDSRTEWASVQYDGRINPYTSFHIEVCHN